MTTTPLAPDVGADRIIEALDAEGYAIIEGYLTPDDVAAKRADLERVLAAVPTGRNDFEGFKTRRIYALFAKTRTFDAQAVDPLILEVVGARLGAGFLLSAPVGICIGPGERSQPIHRDDSVYPVARPHGDLVVNTMWALDDFTTSNGATVLVAGSHRWADRAPSAGDAVRTAVMPAGSVMIYLGSLFHGGGANDTDRPRLGVILEFCAGWLRPQENHVLGVPKEIVTTLDPRLQELLGYNVVGLLGNVDGRHPRKYLDDRRPVADGVVEPWAGSPTTPS
ncbi:MAG TPA: phytanoyl-CoA dioxygenase family protein [Acidimicrobiales bacterium]|nr:phytanoyl-CoA dioxygenase family protein [Acidimicrobiales bacterium]